MYQPSLFFCHAECPEPWKPELQYEEHKTLVETAAVFGCSKEQVRRIAAQAVRKLRFPARVEYYRDGFEVTKKRLEELEAVQEAKRSVLDHILIDDSGLSVKIKNCLRKAGYRSLGDLAKKLKENPDAIIHIPRLGLRSYCEVMDKLESYGIDTSGV